MLVVVVLSITLMWVLAAWVLIGIGSLLLQRMGVEYSLFDSFWAGLSATIVTAQVYHAFRPIDCFLTSLLFVAGVLGTFLNRAVLFQLFLRNVRIGRWLAVAGVAAFLEIAFRCSSQIVHYDTGFYGAMAVRWFVTYPLVPGLTNLLGQLGLNSSVFLGVAILNQGPWHAAGFHLFSGLLLCALIARIIASLSQIFLQENESPLDYFILLFAIPSMVWALNGEIAGTNTDLPTTIVSIAGMISLLNALQEKTLAQRNERRIESLLLVSLMLFSLAVTFKISSLALGVIGWAVAAIQLLLRESEKKRKRQLVIVSLLSSCLIIIPWVWRGLILSGYPFFPSSVFALPADWRVPRDIADQLAQVNRIWARIPHATLAETVGLRWLRPWFSVVVKNRVDFIVTAILSFVGLISLLLRKGKENLFWLQVLVPSIGGLLFWFVLAPAFRFGEAAIWITTAYFGTFALRQMLPYRDNVGKLATLFSLLAIGGWCSYPRTLWRLRFQPSLSVSSFLPLPMATGTPYILGSGLTVNVPTVTNQCWDMTIPCSPYFSDGLKLRREKSLRWGFRVDGPSLLMNFDKFTGLHRSQIQSHAVEEVCANCHFQSK